MLMNNCQASADTAPFELQTWLPSLNRGCNRAVRFVNTPSVSLDISTPLRSRSGCTTYTRASSITRHAARTVNGWINRGAATQPCFRWPAGSGKYRASATHAVAFVGEASAGHRFPRSVIVATKTWRTLVVALFPVALMLHAGNHPTSRRGFRSSRIGPERRKR
jgi:hypothetical protein